MPFRIHTSAAPVREYFEQTGADFPMVHSQAAQEATAHLTRAAQDAMEKAGLPPGVLEHVEHPVSPYVGLTRGNVADRVADIEYGTPYAAPNPVIRTAIRAAMPEARAIYEERLRGVPRALDY